MSLESPDGNCYPTSGKPSVMKASSAGDDRACRRSSGSPLRILVIDDSETVLFVLKEALACFGQKVLAASRGREGLKIYRSHSIDAVVCDLAMPDLSGLQVAERIRTMCSREGLPGTPFILLTGWGEDVDPTGRTSHYGVDRVMAKPVDLGYLNQVIREMVMGDMDRSHACATTSGSSR
jgi:CheY-like chemotaxis protein